MVTHDPELAVRAQRNVHIIDGQVSDLVRRTPSLVNQVDTTPHVAQAA
jgi:putative ABC transport system ATP-binding protein